MPAPALYVLAFVGTIGAAIVFKEFVYEPHIAPRIDKWKAEFQAARQRRAESQSSRAMAELPLLQRDLGKDEYRDPGDDSDHSDGGSGKGRSTLRAPVRPNMKNGFLIRRRNQHSETTPRQPGDVELDDWITGTSTATEKASQQSDLRLRKNSGPLNQSTQSIPHMPLLPTSPPSPTSIGTSAENSNQVKMEHQPIELELKKTTSENTETNMFLDEIDPFQQNQFNTPSNILKPIRAIPCAPLSPIRTPTHVLSNASSIHSPSDSPLATELSLPLRKEVISSKLETSAAGPTSHPLLPPSQPLSPFPRASNASSGFANSANSFPQSSQSSLGLDNIVFQTPGMAVAGVAPLSPINVGSTTISNGSITTLPPLVSPPPTLTLSSPPPQLPSPAVSHTSPYQTPPHLHAIPSLSQSYPLDDLLDYERGLELLSPPSPLSRTDSPFEFAGLSPNLWVGEGSTLLLARNGDRRTSRDQSTPPMDSMTGSTRSTAYLSFPSSPAHSVSSVSASSENGYENDSSTSEISSTFSSPIAAPARLGLGLDLGSESYDRSRLGRSPLLQQQERNVGSTLMRRSVPVSPTPSPGSQVFDARRPPNDQYDNRADTQTLSPRIRTQSPWMMMDRIPSGSAATTLVVSTPESAARGSRLGSDFDTGSELSELDFPGMSSAEEFEVSSPAPAGGIARSGTGSVGSTRSRSGVYTGGDRVVGTAGGMRGPGIGDGSASDTSSWSFAGGSD